MHTSMLGPINAAMEEFDINTPVRMAGFLAQVAHESSSLNQWAENTNQVVIPNALTKLALSGRGPLSPTEYKKAVYFIEKYGNRNNLGNTGPIDGYLFYGRGPIQVTGRANVTKASQEIFGDHRLVRNPSLMETDPSTGFRTSAWFWWDNYLNETADSVNPNKAASIASVNKLISTKINGKNPNHLPERLQLYQNALHVLLQPSTQRTLSPTPSPAPSQTPSPGTGPPPPLS